MRFDFNLLVLVGVPVILAIGLVALIGWAGVVIIGVAVALVLLGCKVGIL